MSIGFDDTWPRRQLFIVQRLRQRRCELGLTQKQVVTRLGRTGVHTTNRALSSLEHGSGMDVAKLPPLAAALDCTVTYLVGLTDDPHRWEPDRPLTSGVPPNAGVPLTAGVALNARVTPRANGTAAAANNDTAPPRSWILGAEVPDRRPRLS
jgi:transcriptional regulator with XRE-family HTH domain